MITTWCHLLHFNNLLMPAPLFGAGLDRGMPDTCPQRPDSILLKRFGLFICTQLAARMFHSDKRHARLALPGWSRFGVALG